MARYYFAQEDIDRLLQNFAERKRNCPHTFVRYDIYQAPDTPTDRGTFIGSTPIPEQAEGAVIAAARRGLLYFMKGITANGAEWYLM